MLRSPLPKAKLLDSASELVAGNLKCALSGSRSLEQVITFDLFVSLGFAVRGRRVYINVIPTVDETGIGQERMFR